MKRGLLFTMTLFFIMNVQGQTIADTSMNIHVAAFHMGGHLPAGNIAERYGMNFGVGASYMYKTKSNWIASADLTFINGSDFKEAHIFNELKDEFGDFINIYGEIGEVAYYERGFYTGVGGGRLFPVIGPNPNSGIIALLNGGFMQYKTLIHQDGRDIPCLQEDYRKGYDYLTNGLSMSAFVGYLHLSNRKPINFYVGMEFVQAWTQNRRDWNFDIMGPDLTKRHDYLFGLKFGWIFPINRRSTDTYYFL